ncbi:MAG TPA: tetratricopeptide repeat protein [Myxococcales bacterium LLY-WYZ-16_1]|jgi:tetratricopeptide (TPR) repeat protein|nr:tetratricopeptide repeat protein [Myxococcales bacterium LLY-WYZ-16_1]
MQEDLKTLLESGREAYERGDHVRAEEALTRAVDRGADEYADIHHILGVIYHSWGRFSKARSAFERALRINPDYTEAALNLAITYNDLGRYAEAKELFEQARPTRPGELDAFARGKIANLHAEVGEAYRSVGDPTSAIREYRKALELGPNFVDIRMRLAQCLAETDALDEAVSELRTLVATKPQFVPAWLHLGLFLMRLDRSRDAEQAFKKCLDFEPEHPRARAYLRMLESKGASH